MKLKKKRDQDKTNQLTSLTSQESGTGREKFSEVTSESESNPRQVVTTLNGSFSTSARVKSHPTTCTLASCTFPCAIKMWGLLFGHPCRDWSRLVGDSLRVLSWSFPSSPRCYQLSANAPRYMCTGLHAVTPQQLQRRQEDGRPPAI